jgi:preprotein translocase subunit SecG
LPATVARRLSWTDVQMVQPQWGSHGLDNPGRSLLSSPFHMTILIQFFTFVLIIISVLLILVVLAQKTKDGGMGAALGGGMTESTFGADTGNVLSKTTIKLTIAFFVISFALYVGEIHLRKKTLEASSGALPTLAVPVKSPASATTTSPSLALPVPAKAPADASKKP